MAQKTKKAARGKKLAKARKVSAVKPPVTFAYGSLGVKYVPQNPTGGA